MSKERDDWKKKKEKQECVICGGSRSYVMPMYIGNLRFNGHKDCRKAIPDDYLAWAIEETGKKHLQFTFLAKQYIIKMRLNLGE